MGPKRKILFLGPLKSTSLRKTTSFDVLIVKIGEGAWLNGIARTSPPKKKTSRVTMYASQQAEMGRKWGAKNLSDRNKILHRGRSPRHHHPCHI